MIGMDIIKDAIVPEIFFLWGFVSNLTIFIKSIKNGNVVSTYNKRYSKEKNKLDYYFFSFIQFLYCTAFFALLFLPIIRWRTTDLEFFRSGFIAFSTDARSNYLLIFGFAWMLFEVFKTNYHAFSRKSISAAWGSVYKYKDNKTYFYLTFFINTIFIINAILGIIFSIYKILAAS